MLPNTFGKVWFWVACPAGLWAGVGNGLLIGLGTFCGVSVAPHVLYKLYKMYKQRR